MPEDEPNWWFELVWSAERNADSQLDLQEFVYDVLEQAKDNLSEDGYLASAAWVITPTEIYCFSIGQKSWEYKEEVYGRLVDKAKELSAEAIVTLNDAYWGEPDDPDPYYQGLAEEGRECIWVNAVRPDKPTISLQAKYKRIQGKIVFEPTEQTEGTKVHLLGSWSKELKEVQ